MPRAQEMRQNEDEELRLTYQCPTTKMARATGVLSGTSPQPMGEIADQHKYMDVPNPLHFRGRGNGRANEPKKIKKRVQVTKS